VIKHSNNAQTSLVDRLIKSQQELTAVEKFSQRHQSITEPANDSLYRDLIPLTAPEAGEQYSFEIDLDACSGCKACVAACHSLNGLEEGEIWRNVGLMTGGDDFYPVVQHVTSACHHCVDPGCMSGCPVRAYEKDPVTGIVEHLDDQCIGCKYCMFTCPYDVPSYSESKGIVRKCNMCVDRLRVGEAPACVQACPNEAIKIRKVNIDDVQQLSEDDSLLPGAPSSALTYPTTRYISSEPVEDKGLPVDYHAPRSQHAHYPLVFMLVLTQMALGTFLVSAWLYFTAATEPSWLWALHILGFASLCGGLGVAPLHLGRPLKAYRAMSGFRTSWLSREIIGFNLFAAAATQLLIAGLWFTDWIGLALLSTIVMGVIAIECSVMLYVATKRPLWTAKRTHALFFLSALILGGSASLCLLSFYGITFKLVAAIVAVATIAKLFAEFELLSHLKVAESTPEKLSAKLIQTEQRMPAMVRVALAVVGGVIGPLLLMTGFLPSGAMGLATIGFACVFAGETLERYLFFAVSVARRMPGAPN
jgi:Fe-S-cluster-containing dehydrogenase component/DMSO reductase anchor subunit